MYRLALDILQLVARQLSKRRNGRMMYIVKRHSILLKRSCPTPDPTDALEANPIRILISALHHS